jgi:RNA polymerase sigma factor (sigma-70 family)
MTTGKGMGSGYGSSGGAILETSANGYAPSPNWEEAYHMYRPLLFGALSKLAGSGFAVPPDEGLDLIHDFFIEAWAAVESNYDPSRSKFTTYLYRSFVNFVRPRIVRSVRWRSTLLPPEDLSRQIEEREEFGRHSVNAAQSPDLWAVKRALEELPAADRELLLCYLEGRETSDRKLARRFLLSRYRLRLKLSDALAQVAVKMSERGSLTDPEWRLALALWQDKRTIREAANMLNRSIGEVQEMRMNLFRHLSNSIHDNSDQGSDAAGGSLAHARVVLEAVLRPAAGAEAFHALRQHAALVLDFLEQPSGEEFFQKHGAHMSVERLSDIYAALGSQEALDDEEVRIRDALLQASEEEDSAIGNAFFEVLLPTLPDRLTNFAGHVFLGAPTIEPEICQKILLTDLSVRRGGPMASDLVRFGITPVTILVGSQGVADLARRFCAAEKIERGQKLILDRGGTRGHSGFLPILARDSSIREVRLVTELPGPTAERLFNWLAAVSGYVSQLFNGFDAQMMGDQLWLQRTDLSVENLYERWFSPPDLAVA